MASSLTPSPVESARFGLTVHRGDLDRIEPQSLAAHLRHEAVDLAIIRVPATEQPVLHELDVTGMPWFVADSLIYFSCDLAGYEPRPLRNPLTLRQASHADRETLNRLIERTFSGYANHYSANPVLDRAAITAGMVEWAVGFIDRSDAEVFLADIDGEVAGFATCTFGAVSEAVLFGVAPDYEGRGVYGDLTRFAVAEAARRGSRSIKTSTQAHNFAVRRSWISAGYLPQAAYVTVHINAMRSALASLESTSVAGSDLDDGITDLTVDVMPTGRLVASRRRDLSPVSGDLVYEVVVGRTRAPWPQLLVEVTQDDVPVSTRYLDFEKA